MLLGAHQDARFFNASCPISLSRAPKLLGEIVGKFRGQEGSPSTPPGGEGRTDLQN